VEVNTPIARLEQKEVARERGIVVEGIGDRARAETISL
jgi:hypothetical protein